MPKKLYVVLLLCAALCVSSTLALAQGTGFPDLGHIGPSTGEVVGILVGAGVGIAVVVYLVIPKQKTIHGCIQSNDAGFLLDDKYGHTYALATTNGVTLRPGRWMTLIRKAG